MDYSKLKLYFYTNLHPFTYSPFIIDENNNQINFDSSSNLDLFLEKIKFDNLDTYMIIQIRNNIYIIETNGVMNIITKNDIHFIYFDNFKISIDPDSELYYRCEQIINNKTPIVYKINI